MVRCKRNALYTGISTDVIARVKKHNAGKGAKSIKALGLPCVLVYQEEVGTYSEALKREISIKKLSKKKKELIVTQFSKEKK